MCCTIIYPWSWLAVKVVFQQKRKYTEYICSSRVVNFYFIIFQLLMQLIRHGLTLEETCVHASLATIYSGLRCTLHTFRVSAIGQMYILSSEAYLPYLSSSSFLAQLLTGRMHRAKWVIGQSTFDASSSLSSSYNLYDVHRQWARRVYARQCETVPLTGLRVTLVDRIDSCNFA